jgi:UDP-glucose 4-epimerase
LYFCVHMNILVTGGAGFIGSHTVVELSNAGHTAVIVDNLANATIQVLDGLEAILGKKQVFYNVDVLDTEALKTICLKHQIDGVIHFAAYKAVGESVADPLKYYHNNIGTLVSTLEVCKALGIANYVFSSSCTVYGEPDIIPITEDTPRKKASSPYGNTKAMCEDILEDSTQVHAIRALALRYFNPIGAHPSALIGELPNGRPSNLLPFITQTAAGNYASLTVHGGDYPTKDGTNIRDYIHIVDLAKAHVAALEYLAARTEPSLYDVFNVGTGRGNTVLEIIEAFEKQNNIKLNYSIGPKRPGDVVQIYGDVTKIKQKLGWAATKTLEESVKDAWAWQKQISK